MQSSHLSLSSTESEIPRLDGAKTVMEKHDGILPETAEGLLDIDGMCVASFGSERCSDFSVSKGSRFVSLNAADLTPPAPSRLSPSRNALPWLTATSLAFSHASPPSTLLRQRRRRLPTSGHSQTSSSRRSRRRRRPLRTATTARRSMLAG